MANVELDGVKKRYEQVEVVHGVDLDIVDREFVVFVGPSGCGKSTLLRMIAGLEEITDGEIRIGDTRVNETAPANRGVAMVFQSYALYPHLSVADNMSLGLKMAGVPKAEIEPRVKRAAGILQIEQLLDRKPRQLSGGQRQRVAIGRAIVKQPKVFLFDEPLSNLDAELRVQMRVEINALHRELHATMIYVTHDQEEAMTMADRIVVLKGGRVEQVGAPMELYRQPGNRFVAGFIGSPRMNFLEAAVAGVDGSGTALDLPGSARLVIDRPVGAVDRVTVGIRPEDLEVRGGTNGAEAIDGEVLVVEHLGASSHLHVRLPSGERLVAVGEGGTALEAGMSCHCVPTPGRTHLFDPAGQALA